MNHKCAICQEYISGAWWVCEKCRVKFGLVRSQKQWPLWVKAAVADENLERRRAKLDAQFISQYALEEFDL